MKYEIIKHGVEWSQHFQGCGTAFTDFDHVVTGIGDSEAEAFDDATEQIAMGDYQNDGALAVLLNALEKEGESMSTTLALDGIDYDDQHPYVHVSIRYSLIQEVA